MLAKSLKLFFLLVFFILFLCAATKAASAELNNQEIKEIQLFIKNQIKTNTLGHALYGSKPICLMGFRVNKDIDEDHPFHSLLLDQQHIYDNSLLEALKKLSINNKSFSLTLHESKDKWGYDLYECLFINNKALKKNLKKHLNIFQKELKTSKDVDELIVEIHKSGFEKLFKNKPILQGILLGYGAQNAISWAKMKALKEYSDSDGELVSTNQLMRLMQEYPNGYLSLSEELSDFDLKERETTSIQFYYHTQSKESQKIIKDLEKADKKARKSLNSSRFLKDFFDAI